MGYTPYYTAAVWSGYDRQERINSAGNPSCILWQKVMSAVSEGETDIGLNGDLETTTAYCCTASGLLATKACTAAGCGKNQVFLAGDAPSEYCDRHYYSNGSMILNYQRTGAAAKAKIRGEVSYIPKKVVKPKKETPVDPEAEDEDNEEEDEDTQANKKTENKTNKTKPHHQEDEDDD